MSESINRNALLEWLDVEIDLSSGNDNTSKADRWAFRQVKKEIESGRLNSPEMENEKAYWAREGLIKHQQSEIERQGKHILGLQLELEAYREDVEIDKTPFYYKIGESVLFYWEDEWRQGKIANGYRTHDGIINVELDNGEKVWCGEARREEFIKLA